MMLYLCLYLLKKLNQNSVEKSEGIIQKPCPETFEVLNELKKKLSFEVDYKHLLLYI